MVVFDHQFLQEHIADLVDRERHGLRLGAALGDVRVEEFERGREYYERLGIGDRCDLCLNPGGHEVVVDSGLEFIAKWL